MIQNAQKALDYVLDSEGPELNVSESEPGGASKYGVSVSALSDYHKKIGLPPATIADVSKLTDADARKFYAAVFMPPIRFDDLPSGVDYRLLDIEINLGISGGIAAFRRVLGISEVGAMTDADVAIAKSVDSKDLIADIEREWLAVKARSPHWPLTAKPSYQHGWTNRAKRVTAQALAMAGVS